MNMKVSIEIVNKDNLEIIPVVKVATKLIFTKDMIPDNEILEQYELKCLKNWLKILQNCKLKYDKNNRMVTLDSEKETYFKAQLDRSKSSNEFDQIMKDGSNIILQAILDINDSEYLALGESTTKGYWIEYPSLYDTED